MCKTPRKYQMLIYPTLSLPIPPSLKKDSYKVIGNNTTKLVAFDMLGA